MSVTPPTVVTFYLPQFHPVPENDAWWGKGFTEWTNVVTARPRFRGHEQPHLPTDLGYYDLRVHEVRDKQAELARRYGVSAFCYYHYWFNGRRLLNEPLDGVLETGQPDLPFVLCWANESWTRAWDGASSDTLIAQEYGEDDDRDHIRWLCEVFADERYLRIGGKPLFLVYRASELPDPRSTTQLWREEAANRGIGELVLGRVESFRTEREDPRPLGFDLAVEFQPDWVNLGPRLRQGRRWNAARALKLTSPAYARDRIYDYATVADSMTSKPDVPWPRLPCVTPRWDNTARRSEGATVLRRSTPDRYAAWLEAAVERSRRLPEPYTGLVFVNAWNEWGEGCHLEPCSRWGRAYLEATLRETLRAAGAGRRSRGTDPKGLPTRALDSMCYRLARHTRRGRRRVRDLARPLARAFEDRRRPAVVEVRPAPPALLVSVYRRANEATVAPLVREARARGWAVALWALDEAAPSLAEWTVGGGPGARVDLLNRLVATLDPGPDEYVVLADDDVSLIRGSLGELLNVAERCGLALAQPAHARSSHATYPFTFARPGLNARRTDFVEIGPLLCIAPSWRDRILPFPEGYGMGWGLELEWAALSAGGCPVGIVDAVRVRHTGPPATRYDQAPERARVNDLLDRHGRSSMEDLQVVRAAWWRWQRPPDWRKT